jgi:hypothetical protein
MVAPMARLPGCKPITYSNAVKCSQNADPSTTNNVGTFHILSKFTGLYLTFNSTTQQVLANCSTQNPTYQEVWGLGWAPKNLGQTVRNSQVDTHLNMQDTVRVKGGTPDTWEVFSFEQQANSSYVVIKNLRYNKYLKVEQDSTISGQATAITNNCLFKLVTPNGGFAPAGITLVDLPTLSATVG